MAKEIKMSEFFEEILDWFLRDILRDKQVIYRASKQEGHLMTIRMPEKLATSISHLAIKEKVSGARIIYTALTNYLENHKI